MSVLGWFQVARLSQLHESDRIVCQDKRKIAFLCRLIAFGIATYHSHRHIDRDKIEKYNKKASTDYDEA